MPKIVTRYGELETLDPKQDLICKILAKYGEWAQYEVRFVASALPDNARIADVGAFLGTFSLGVAQLTKVAFACLVDANPAVVPLLRHNIEKNLAAEHVVVEGVVGASGSAPNGFVDPANAGSFSLVANRENRVSAPAAQRAVSLSELADQYGPFDLIKLDAEGMEREIIESSLDYTASSNASLWIECNETPESLNLAELLLQQGYRLSYVAFPALSPTNFNQCEEIDFPFAYEAGLWATRGASPVLDASLVEAGCVLKVIDSKEALRHAMWTTPRWAPKDWEGHDKEEIVAMAAHALLGESIGDYPWDASYQQSGRRWMPAVLQERIHELNVALDQATQQVRASEIVLFNERERATQQVRASEIVLFNERERAKHAIRTLEDELRTLSEQAQQLTEQIRQTSEERQRSEQQAHAVTASLLAIQQSTSWRLTRPIRVVSRVLRGDWSELRRLWSVHRSGERR
ncbi:MULTISPECIES: FkbM family methyltransferase [unclassified Caballeronia]|uniref:FkbM family methyltransferase n=1 Tax=unclassified Caballeronia TaxID=2646786 RepID=UPI002028A8D0|nr:MULTISPECIES: FkbM family methyltransferase [unclassified Caballeronia]